MKPKFRPLVTKTEESADSKGKKSGSRRTPAGLAPVLQHPMQASCGTLLAWSLFVASTLPDAEPHCMAGILNTTVPMLAREGRFQQA